MMNLEVMLKNANASSSELSSISSDDIKMEEEETRRTIDLVAHRGGDSMYPENTIECIKEAFENGANGVEIDVMLTKDDRLVVFHDESLQRMTNNKYKDNVSDVNWDQLKNIKISNYDDNNGDSSNSDDGKVYGYVPLLSDVLPLVPNGCKLYIEVKGGDIENRVDTDRLLPILIKNLTKKGMISNDVLPMVDIDRMCVISFDHNFINSFKKKLPSFEAYYLTVVSYFPGNWIELRSIETLEKIIENALKNNINGIIHEYGSKDTIMNEEFVSLMELNNLTLGIWVMKNCDTNEAIIAMQNIGANFFVTDAKCGYNIV